MTLRLDRLKEELPKNNFNVYKTGKLVGYADSYADSTLYNTIKKSKKFKEYFNEDSVRKNIKKAYKRFEKEKDNSNLMRALELQTKISGLITEKSEHKIISEEKKNEANDIAKQLNIIDTPTDSRQDNLTNNNITDDKIQSIDNKEDIKNNDDNMKLT